MYHSFLIHSSPDGHLGCFHVLTRIERDTWTPMFITALFIIARSFLMGETDWGGNWILFWWAGPCSVQFSSVQSLSHVRLFVTPCTTVPQASLSITNSRSLLKLMSTESVMPSNHLILCCPLLFLPSIFPSIRVFSNVSPSHQVAKVLELQLQHQSFQWIFRTDFL